MVQIAVGRNPYSDEEIFFNERLLFGVNIIAAITRYGKSALTKLLYTMISKHRPVLIFDYMGEHINCQFPNWRGDKYIRCVENLTIVEDLGYKISDFGNVSDWTSLGFPSNASLIISELARRSDIHNDNPDTFFQLLSDLPISYEGVEFFNDKYKNRGQGLTYNGLINTSSKDSMITKFRFIMTQRLFIYREEIEDGTRTYIENFGLFMKDNPRICINFKMAELNVFLARAYVGKILEQLAPYLLMIKPLIVLEEADKLVPNIEDGDSSPSSLTQVLTYVIKLQKYNPELLMLCQDLNLINSTVVGNAHIKILGQLPDTTSGELKEYTKKLRWDFDANYREFVMIKTGDRRRKVFVPYQSPCEC